MRSDLNLLVNREDTAFVAKHGKRKAFHLRSNSSCRQHIRSHYELYKTRCAQQMITENPHAIPRDLFKQKENPGQQKTLDGQFAVVLGMRAFLRESVLKMVAEFVVCDDQVCKHSL